MNLENRFPKKVRDRAKEITQGYRGPNGKGRSPEGRAEAKQWLHEKMKYHSEGEVYFDTLPEAVRFVRDKMQKDDFRAEYSLVAPMDDPEDFGYCAVAGTGFATAIRAGRRLVAHETDLTKEILDNFLAGLDTDTIEEV